MKNYTSSVPVDRTVARIEAALVRGGAREIAKDYGAKGELSGVCFKVMHPELKHALTIRLPANAAAVYDVLRAEVRRPRPGTLDRIKEQAMRTAWKIVQDWVEVQISLIEMRQAEFLQVFLPYVWNGHQTFFGQLKESSFAMLTDGKT